MEAARIRYAWEGKALGGIRGSYMDHMRTDEFRVAAAGLTQFSPPVCILCAERDPAQ